MRQTVPVACVVNQTLWLEFSFHLKLTHWMKNRSPACERQSCWHEEGTGRPEAQKEHKVLTDMIQLFACRPCLLIQFDLSSSKLPLKIFLCSQAEPPRVTAPSCCGMCWWLCKLLLLCLKKQAKWEHSPNLYFWIVLSYSRKKYATLKTFCV